VAKIIKARLRAWRCEAAHIQFARLAVSRHGANPLCGGRSDKSGNKGESIYRKWGIGFLALPAVLAIALFGLSILQPPTSNWIAEIVQAEFTGISLMPREAPPEQAPTQFAQPGTQIRTAHTD
jgi:hypothetical protein